jgi:hypothetical protein
MDHIPIGIIAPEHIKQKLFALKKGLILTNFLFQALI